MRALLYFLAFSFFAIAGFIPSKTYTQVVAVNGDRITMAEPFALNGMSGLVVRNLSTGRYALVYVKQIAPKEAVVIDTNPLNAKGLAKIKPVVKVGDRVIGGFLYDKVMVLAPNRSSYINIQNRFGIRSINPDLFMAFLAVRGSSTPSSSDFKEFAKLNGIGLFVIFKNGFVALYDPISEETIGKMMMDISAYNEVKPFYNTFK